MPKICKWYNCCPIKYFVESGKLEKRWVEEFCFVSNPKCVRYQLEEKNITHSDNMLPNGEIREELK